MDAVEVFVSVANILLTWQHTKKINNVIAVHNTFSLNWI